MNTCSNCGAAVRPGAKFCTACGTRLNDVSASSATSEWTSGQPASDTTRVVEVSDAPGSSPASGGSPVDIITAHGSGSSDTVPVPATTEAGAPESPTTWSWRSSPGDSASSTPVPADSDSEDESIESPSAEPRVFIVDKRDEAPASSSTSTPDTANAGASADEFTWTWGSQDNEDTWAETETGTVDSVPEPADASSAVARDATAAAGSQPKMAEFSGEDGDMSASRIEDTWNTASTSGNGVDSSADDPEHVRPATAADVEYPDQESMPAGREVLRVVIDSAGESDHDASSGEPASTGTDEDPLDRARRLVEELRTLIPPPRPFGHDAPEAVNPAVERLRDELESARSTSDFGDLRSTIESARERPRDVDTMLAMVGQIDSMLDALDDRDRLASAVERAIGLLETDVPPAAR